jgi:hypothetical protein
MAQLPLLTVTGGAVEGRGAGAAVTGGDVGARRDDGAGDGAGGDVTGDVVGTVGAGRCTTITCWGGGAPTGCVAGVADGVEPALPAMIPASPSATAALNPPATKRAPDAAWRRRRGRVPLDGATAAARRWRSASMRAARAASGSVVIVSALVLATGGLVVVVVRGGLRCGRGRHGFAGGGPHRR